MLLTINHQKGGVGKSTLAWNLAIELAKQTNKTIEVVDLDVQQTLTLNNKVRIKNEMEGFDIKTFNDKESFDSYIDTDNDSKIIIVDSGGFDSGLNRLAALYSDLIITPVSDSIVDLQGLKVAYQKIINELNEKASEEVKVSVLLNNIDPRRKNLDNLIDFVNEGNHFNTLNTVVRRRADFQNSIAESKSVIELNKESKASLEIQALINEIKPMLVA